jgi:hypothetical protein
MFSKPLLLGALKAVIEPSAVPALGAFEAPLPPAAFSLPAADRFRWCLLSAGKLRFGDNAIFIGSQNKRLAVAALATFAARSASARISASRPCRRSSGPTALPPAAVPRDARHASIA